MRAWLATWFMERVATWSQRKMLAGSLAAGLAVAGWIWWTTGRVSVTEEQAPEALLSRELPPSREWWEVTEQQQPDGTWMETGRVRKRKRMDGAIEELKGKE